LIIVGTVENNDMSTLTTSATETTVYVIASQALKYYSRVRWNNKTIR
jgi:hypothetical protein